MRNAVCIIVYFVHHQIQNMQENVGQIVKSRRKVGQIEKFGEKQDKQDKQDIWEVCAYDADTDDDNDDDNKDIVKESNKISQKDMIFLGI